MLRILLDPRQRSGFDKMLAGLLGLIAVYEALRILKDCGPWRSRAFAGVPELGEPLVDSAPLHSADGQPEAP